MNETENVETIETDAQREAREKQERIEREAKSAKVNNLVFEAVNSLRANKIFKDATVSNISAYGTSAYVTLKLPDGGANVEVSISIHTDR